MTRENSMSKYADRIDSTRKNWARRFAFALAWMHIAVAPTTATDFDWDSGGGGILWSTNANWDPDAVPGISDRVVLTGSSLDGPQVIDLGGVTQRITSVSTQGVDGTYTFTNGTLELFGSPGNRTLADTGGGNMIFNNDLLIAESGEHFFNIVPSGGMIIINGDLSTTATSGTTTMNLTSRNTNLSQGVVVNGMIGDNAGGARVGLTAGFAGDSNHSGTVVVTGLNTFTGSTKINHATLEINSIANVGAAANALGQPALADSLIEMGVSGSNSARLRYVGSGHGSDREIRLEGANSAGTIDASGTGALSLSGDFLTVGSGTVRTLKLSGDNLNDNTYAGIIQAGAGTGRLDLVKEGVGKWMLTGDNTMDGNTLVSAGELVIGAGGAIRTPVTGIGGTTVDVSSGGTLTLAVGVIETRDIDIATGGTFNFRSGTLIHDAGESTFVNDLVIGSDVGDAGGHMAVNASQGGGHVFKALTINDAADSLTVTGGQTTVDSIDNSNGGTLTMSGGAVNVNSGGQITTGAGTLNTTINGAGGLTKIGSGTLTMGAVTPTYSGPTNIQGGTLEVHGGGRLSDGSHITVDSGATLRLLTGSGDAVFGLSGAGHVDIGDAGFVVGNSIAPGSAGGGGSFSGTLDGTGSLEKRGLGTFTLEAGGSLTHEGTTEVENGRLVVNGTIDGTSEVRVVNGPLSSGGKLTVNARGDIKTSGNITAELAGNGSLITLNGGRIESSKLDLVNGSGVHAGSLIWNSGQISIADGVRIGGTIDADTPFEDSLTLDTGKTLYPFTTTEIAANGTLTIDGGKLLTATLDNSQGGTFNFVSGELHLLNHQIFDAEFIERADLTTPLFADRQLTAGQATIDAPIVLAGGTLRVATIANPENLILSSGLLQVMTGSLDVAASTSIDTTTGMSVEVHIGALNIAAGGAYNAIGSTLDVRAASANDGAINATLQFDFGLTNNGDLNLINTTINGSVSNSPGSSSMLTGTNSVSGDYTMSDGSSLQIDIMGTQAGDYDTLTVDDVAVLDGALLVALEGDFVPAPGDSFAIVTAGGGFGGMFDSLLLPTLGDSLDWQLNPDGNTLFLNVISGMALVGDFDGSGTVSAGDLNLVLSLWGQDGGDAPSTWINDRPNGIVAAAQLNTVLNNWGSTANIASVPEPSPGLFALLGLIALLRRR